jgi:hypothetical protein
MWPEPGIYRVAGGTEALHADSRSGRFEIRPIRSQANSKSANSRAVLGSCFRLCLGSPLRIQWKGFRQAQHLLANPGKYGSVRPVMQSF